MKFIALHFLFLIGINFSYCSMPSGMQRYATKGRLLCGTVPAAHTRVSLVDIDRPGWDDVMDESVTNENGEFFLDGQTKEITPIDPVLKIYHDCSDGLPCQRRWKMALPKTYITEPGANILNKTYDIGVYNLEINWKKEVRRCDAFTWT